MSLAEPMLSPLGNIYGVLIGYRQIERWSRQAATSNTGKRNLRMSAERPVLIVDDDDALRETLVDQLAVDGEFVATEAASIQAAEACLASKDARFDAIILDVGLPDGDGRDLCSKLRKQGHRMPIIMLTGLDSEHDVVRGLDCGANDYIAKPFKLAVLLARLRAQLRIFENSEDAVFSIGPYTFRPAAKLLQEPAKNRRIRLTEKEAAILKFLYRAGTRSVARQVLLNEVWGYNAAVTTHTLETHIYRLRQKIEPDPANARLLVTEGGGYRLDPEGIPATRVPAAAHA
jgi:DNA-binding response OmpR family regulator